MYVNTMLDQIHVTLEIRPISTRTRLPLYKSADDARQLPNLSSREGDWLHQIYHAKILHRLVTDAYSRSRVCLAILRDGVSGTDANLAAALQVIGRDVGATMPDFGHLSEWWEGQPEPLEAGVEEHIRLIDVD